MGLERGIELRGLNEIVLDSVARPDHLRRLEPGERSNQFELHRSREAHRVAVQVHFVDVQTLRLQKEVMSIAIRESHDLVFERRAIPRTNPTNLPVEERGLGDVPANELVDPGGRVQRIAGDLLPIDRVRREGEGDRRSVPFLPVEHREVDAAAMQARRRSGLQPAPPEPAGLERLARAHVRAARPPVRLASAHARCGRAHSGTSPS